MLACNCPDGMNKAKAFLGSKFEMKDMDETSCVFSVRISSDRNSSLLYLDQEKYPNKVHKRFNIQSCNALSAPVCKERGLSKSMCPKNEEELQETKNVMQLDW